MTRQQALNDYWAAQAQFGPLDVGPEEFLKTMPIDDEPLGPVTVEP